MLPEGRWKKVIHELPELSPVLSILGLFLALFGKGKLEHGVGKHLRLDALLQLQARHFEELEGELEPRS